MGDLYNMAQGPDFNPFESFMKGRQLRQQDTLTQNKLAELARADQARPLFGQAVMGSQSALNSLSQLDPANALEVQKFNLDNQKAQREVSDAEKQQIVGALYAADTPEKWQQTINYLKSQGHDIEPQAMDFNNRDAILGASIGPKGMQDQFNGQTQRMNAMKTAQGQQRVLKPGETLYNEQNQPIATAPMPAPKIQPRALTSVDKQAILTADDQVQTGKNVVDMLTQALSLNDKAGSGYGAGAQAFIARNAPDFIANHDPTDLTNRETGAATTDFNNIVMNQALSSMKTLFGGNPTEGERAVLLDLQASINKAPYERKAILERGIKLAQRRVAYNEERAKELRAGTYFGGASTVEPSQGGEPAPTQQDMGGGSQGWNEQDIPQIIQDATDAIQQGADPEAVIQDMVNNGVDPDYARLLLNGQ